MRCIMKRMSAVCAILAICVSIFIVPTSARSSYYLSAYSAWLNPKANGEISVTVDVQATDYMDSIGSKRIQILESKNNGVSWTEYRAFLPIVYPDMLKSNEFLYYDTPVSFTGTPGYTYCAIVTVYAGDSTGSDSREYTTPMVTAKN